MFKRSKRRCCLAIGLSFAAVLAAAGCGDDSVSGTGSATIGTITATDTESGTATDSSETDSTTVATSGVSVGETGTTGTDSSDDTMGSTSGPMTGSTGTTTGETDTDSTTGGEMVSGQSMNQLVSAGTKTSSRNYTLVFTFGQPSQLQSTHQSASYRLQGGLVGANGSPP